MFTARNLESPREEGAAFMRLWCPASGSVLEFMREMKRLVHNVTIGKVYIQCQNKIGALNILFN